jgi:hypothetical protein
LNEIIDSGDARILQAMAAAADRAKMELTAAPVLITEADYTIAGLPSTWRSFPALGNPTPVRFVCDLAKLSGFHERTDVPNATNSPVTFLMFTGGGAANVLVDHDTVLDELRKVQEVIACNEAN